MSSAWGDAADDAKAALKAIRDLAKETFGAIGDPPGELDQRAARLLPLWMDLAQRVRSTYRIAKDERGALDFDDLETLTRQLLQDDAVRARYLGAEFHHVLVDEFQDTNDTQWKIIQRIADPALPGCLFVVGDPKQSIYAFRGADVRVFDQVRAELRRIGGVEIDLSISFRTHERLIGCFNALFERILRRDEASPAWAYEVEFGGGMQAARIDAPCDAPPLEMILLDKDKLADDDSSMREWEARAVARRLKQMVEDEARPIYDKRAQRIRPMNYGDAALLFQAMTHVTLYEEALKAEGIPYLTVAGKGYYNRQEVWDLLNLLRALYNPADQLALATALRSPLFGLSDDALLALRLILDSHGKPIPLWDALDQPDRVPADEIALVGFARDTLRDLRRKAGRVTIAELLRLALDHTGYMAVLTGLPDGKRKRGNVEKLIDKAETSGRLTLSAFTRYLREMSSREAREGQAAVEAEGAVQLLTVHKSKGLEFPVVVLVDASYQRYGGASGLVNGLACKVYDGEKMISTYAHQRAEQLAQLREDAERLRLLYVAATRAQDTLLISGQVTAKDGQGISARGWLGKLIDALELDEVTESRTVTYSWGEARVDFPEPMEATESDEALVAWAQAANTGDPPPLLQAVDQTIDPRLLAVAQIADLGSAYEAMPPEDRAYYVERWKRNVLHAAPSRIESARWTSQAKVGDIVHRAVRWPLPEREIDMRDLLRKYAWEEGIVDEGENQHAVSESFSLLQRVRRSDVFYQIEHAREVYRELPFVYQTENEKRTIHGVIDLLLQGADGQWRVVDYKTVVLRLLPTPEVLDEHARRYHLQMGIYGAAVQELIGAAPLAMIHYVRYAQTVIITENAWKRALEQLEVYIGDVIKDG